MTRIAQVRGLIQALFPERHLYLRSGGEMKGVVLSPARQMFFAALVIGAVVWIATSSIAIAVGAFTQSRSDRELARMQARSERWVADREARLNSAVAQLNASDATLGGLAETIEKRHAALRRRARAASLYRSSRTPVSASVLCRPPTMGA